MAWAWVRPADLSVLEGRPFLDLGTGDGQTLAALVTGGGLVVGLDRSPDALRTSRHSPLAAGAADALPFGDGIFAVVLAADVFHHLDEAMLERTLAEARRVLRPDGLLVAWWYERPSRPGPDAPPFPRPSAHVAEVMRAAGFAPSELALEFRLEPAPATAGLIGGPTVRGA